MSTPVHSLFIILLVISTLIGVYNWIYRGRIEKVRHQLGVELPALSIVLLKIGTFCTIFSFGLIAFFLFFMS